MKASQTGTEATLHHRIEGRGDAVVLLHPVGLDLHCWDAIAPDLARTRTVIRVDLRGHGGSRAADPATSLSDYAADLDALLGALAVGPAAVVGLSFGGMVAQTLAIEHPRAVARLVVAGCPSTLSPEARKILSERGEAARSGGMAAVLDETLTRWFTPEFLATGGADVIRDRLLRTDPAAWNAAWQAISRIDTAPRLHAIACPTLCIAGTKDVAAPPQVLAAIADAVPGARFVLLQEAPHMMPVECPAAFLGALNAFLAG
jgi:3-oxoadipate enol-lactonase